MIFQSLSSNQSWQNFPTFSYSFLHSTENYHKKINLFLNLPTKSTFPTSEKRGLLNTWNLKIWYVLIYVSRQCYARKRHSASKNVTTKEKKGKMTILKAPHTNHQVGSGSGNVKDYVGCKGIELVWRINGNYPIGFLRQQTRGRYRSVGRKKCLSFYNHCSIKHYATAPENTSTAHFAPPTVCYWWQEAWVSLSNMWLIKGT